MEEMININEWYKDLTCDDTIVLLDEKITNMRLDFIAAGFYMKRVRDEEYFRTLGYDTIWEFAEDRYGIQRSTASRWMAMNDKYSKDGNSPILLEEYREFNKSQLQEMLYLTDEQVQEVTPNMTVKEIREVRKPEPKEEKAKCEKPNDMQRKYLNDAAKHLIICYKDWFLEDYFNRVLNVSKSEEAIKSKLGYKTWRFATDMGTASCSPFSDFVQLWSEKGKYIGKFEWFYLAAAIQSMWNVVALEEIKPDNQANSCATSHTEDVEDSNQEEQLPGQMHITDFPEYMPEPEVVTDTDVLEEMTETEAQGNIIDVSYEEIEESENIKESILGEESVLKIARELLDKEKRLLNDFLKEFDRNDIRCKRYEIKVAALALFVTELEDQINPVFTVEQSELPVLKNNDQRKEFLESYKNWPVWFVVPEASETYYRYNFDDGSSIVICEYGYYSEWRKKYNNEDPNAVGTREYLLTPGYRYLEDCKANTSFLVEHLKKVQKKEK